MDAGPREIGDDPHPRGFAELGLGPVTASLGLDQRVQQVLLVGGGRLQFGDPSPCCWEECFLFLEGGHQGARQTLGCGSQYDSSAASQRR